MRIKNYISAGLSATLILTMPMYAFAASGDTIIVDAGEKNIYGDVDYSGDRWALEVNGKDAKASVSGSVKAPSGNGVYGNFSTKTEIGGDVEAGDTGIWSTGEADISVKGDVRTGVAGIKAEGDSKVTVEGSVSSDKYGIMSDGWGSTENGGIDITVKGDVSGKDTIVDARRGAVIRIEGNAEGEKTGIFAQIKGPHVNDVTLDGNLTIKTTDDSYGVRGAYAWDGSNVSIGGDVTIIDAADIYEKGGTDWTLSADGGSTLTVGGDVDSEINGIAAGKGTVIVEGSVEAGGSVTAGLYGKNSTIVIKKDLKAKDGSDININAEYRDCELSVGGTVQNDENKLNISIKTDDNGKPKELPEIVIGEIADTDNIEIVNQYNETVSEETKKEFLDSIKYIVNTNPESMEGKGAFTITKLNGDALDRDGQNNYDVAKRSEQIVVRIAVSSGYEVGSFSAGKNNTYIRNADGSYTITVADGGGINIEAFIRAIENDPDPEKPKTIGDGGSGRDGSGVTAGSFVGTGRFATFKKADGTTAKNEWINVSVNGTVRRCRVDENGFLKTGWYTENGDTFYLEDKEGADYGFMQTGWRLIDGKWYYFMPYDGIAGGTAVKLGAMLKGVTTPDSYKVGSDGTYTE